MMGRIGRVFTVIGILLLAGAWLWWLYAYRSVGAIDCLYLPGACPAAPTLLPLVTLPPYNPMVLWAGAAAVLLGAVFRISARA